MSKKKCFCIKDGELINDDEENEIINDSNIINDDDNMFMLTPNISDHMNTNDQKLCVISDLMTIAIEKAEKAEKNNKIKPYNVEVQITNNDKLNELEKMAKTSGKNYKEPGDMNLFTHEDFACNNICSKNSNMGMFEHEETKYLLFIIAVLFLCVIMFRK